MRPSGSGGGEDENVLDRDRWCKEWRRAPKIGAAFESESHKYFLMGSRRAQSFFKLTLKRNTFAS